MATIGGIDEGGFLNTFERKGFDTLSSADELIANSYDAKASNVIISKEEEWICISDDGVGMNETDADFMFQMYKRKTRNNTIGMANSGAKHALYNLSNKQKAKIITLKNRKFITIYIDWDKMIKENKYTNNITYKPSTEDEINLFNSIEINRNSGTSILFKYIPQIWEILENQFTFIETLNINKSLSVRYGHTLNFNITLITNSQHIELKKYNPQNNSNIIHRKISILKDVNNEEIHYISDKNEEIKSVGRGFSKKTTIIHQSEIEKYEFINHLDVYISLPEDETYHKDGSSWYPPQLNIYAENNENDKLNASLYPFLVRNDYTLGCIPIMEFQLSGRRASYEGRLYYDLYTVVKSNQTHLNTIDDILGTQENKGQLQDSIPMQIKRLIHHFKLSYIETINSDAKIIKPDAKEKKSKKNKDDDTTPNSDVENAEIDTSLKSDIENTDVDTTPNSDVENTEIDTSPKSDVENTDVDTSLKSDVENTDFDTTPNSNVENAEVTVDSFDKEVVNTTNIKVHVDSFDKEVVNTQKLEVHQDSDKKGPVNNITSEQFNKLIDYLIKNKDTTQNSLHIINAYNEYINV